MDEIKERSGTTSEEAEELFESEVIMNSEDREQKKVIQIFVKTVDERASFRVRESELIGRFKVHAMKRFKIDLSQESKYYFLYGGRALDDKKTFEQENIPEHAELFLKNEPQVG
jgi:hypothetical protein